MRHIVCGCFQQLWGYSEEGINCVKLCQVSVFDGLTLTTPLYLCTTYLSPNSWQTELSHS